MRLKPKIKTTETYKYQTYFDEGGTAIFIADARKGTIVDCNKEAVALLKRPKSDLIGSHQSTLHPKKEAKRYEAKFKEHVKSGETVDFEAVVIDNDGKTIPVIISAKLMELDGHMLIEGSFIDIRPLKATEWELYKEKENFKTIFDNVSDLIVYLDNKGIVLQVNKRSQDLLGIKPKEMVGKHFLSLGIYQGPLKAGELSRIFNDLVLKGEKVKALELNVKNKKGKVFPVEVSTAPVKKDGQIIGVLSMAKDICERKELEDAEKKSQKKYKAIFDNLQDQVVYLDTMGRIIELNKRSKDIFGYKPTELIGKHFMQVGLFKLKDIPQAMKCYRQVVKGETVGPFEMGLKGKKGHLIHTEITLTPVKTNKHVEGFVCVIKDLRKTKRVERTLEELKVKYKDLIDLSPDGVVVVDAKGYIVEANQKALKMAGYKRSEYVGKHFSKLGIFDKKDIPYYTKIFRNALKGKAGEPVKVKYKDKKGKKHEAEGLVGLIKKDGKIIGGQMVVRPK